MSRRANLVAVPVRVARFDTLTLTFVMTSSARSSDAYGWSLRWRLPLLTFGLVAVLGTAFAWMAYYEVNRALLTAAGDRISVAGGQVVELLEQSAVARLAEVRKLAATPDAQQLLASRHEGSDVVDPPASLRTFVQRNPQASVWVYDAGGQVISEVSHGEQAPNVAAAAKLTAPFAGVSPLRIEDGRVLYQTTAPISSPAADAPAVGYLAVQRPLASAQAVVLIERLIGSGAALKLGNAAADGAWTDLGKPVSAPPGFSPGAAASYTREDGEARLGMALPIEHTPWVLWVEMSEGSVLRPASALLRRMLPFTMVLTALGAVAVYYLGGRVAKPLRELATAAEAIAAGDYARRVRPGRGQEIGRLGAAFNVMAQEVASSNGQLEARVRERTHELEVARAELDQFFLLSLDLLCIAGIDGRFRRVNPAWERVLGWTEADLRTVPYIDLVHPDDRAATEREAAKLAQGAVAVNFENRYRTRSGSYRWLHWNAAPSVERGLIYATAHDVTDRRQTEIALHQYGAELTTVNRELESFSYSVSHDLRAPLRSIDGFAQALAEDYRDHLDDTGRDYLGRIRRAAQRMGMLIDDLLSLSRVTRIELTRTTVDLTAAAKEAALRLQEHEPRRSVEWRIQPGVIVEGDARLLQVAIDNLIGNAWKFTAHQPSPVIEFGMVTSENGDRAVLVRDNGAGFDMAHAGKLFGAFQRLHGVNEFPGTGIGLATVHRIVRRHGGRVWAEGAVGAGATFYFTLEAQ